MAALNYWHDEILLLENVHSFSETEDSAEVFSNLI